MGPLEFLAGAGPAAWLLAGAVAGGLAATLLLLALLPIEGDRPGRDAGRCAGCGRNAGVDGDGHDQAGP